jgi:hypothetical protein
MLLQCCVAGWHVRRGLAPTELVSQTALNEASFTTLTAFNMQSPDLQRQIPAVQSFPDCPLVVSLVFMPHPTAGYLEERRLMHFHRPVAQ